MSFAAAKTSLADVPPGPRGVSFLAGLLGSPSGWLELLVRCARDYGDLAFFRLITIPCCLINSPDAIEYVLVGGNANFTKSEDYRALSYMLGEGLLTSEGDFWKRQRRLIQPAFHRERMLSYGRTMTEHTSRMLDGWRDGEVRDIHRDTMMLTLDIVAECLFSANIRESAGVVGEAIKAVMDRFVTMATLGFLLPAWMPFVGSLHLRRNLRALDQIVYGIIRGRRANPQPANDLLGMLLEARDENGEGMPDAQLRDEVMTLLLAGHETTANTLTWTLYLLAQSPEIQAQLQNEVDAVLNGRTPEASDADQLRFTSMALKESMRLYPPAWGIGRKAIHSFNVGGYRVPAGTNVFIVQWIVHRDARYYPEPERFDPSRWDDRMHPPPPKFTYFPFGGGPRVCVGAGFATMEASLILASLLQRFRFELETNETVEILPSLTLRPRRGLRLRIKKR